MHERHPPYETVEELFARAARERATAPTVATAPPMRPMIVPVTLRELTIDDVSGGLPRMTIDMSEIGGPGPVTYHLAPDAVRALVDAFAGVAQPTPGEARITIKVDTSDLRAMLAADLRSTMIRREFDAALAPRMAEVGNPPPLTADRRMQVISRLADMASHAGRTSSEVAYSMVATRDEYPDVFADLAEYVAQCAAISEALVANAANCPGYVGVRDAK